MEQTYLNRLKAELANKSEEEKWEMFLQEVLLYIKVTDDVDAACFLVLLSKLYIEGYSVESGKWRTELNRLSEKKEVRNIVSVIINFRNKYKDFGFLENILMIEKRSCVILETMNRDYLKRNFYYLFMDVLSICEDYENSTFSKCIQTISFEKRCVWARVIVRLLNPKGCIFNPRAGSGWLSAFLPANSEYIVGNSHRNLYLIEQVFQVFSERISSMYKTDYPKNVEFDSLIWFADYSHKNRMTDSRITSSIDSEYYQVFNRYIPSLPDHGRAACVVMDNFWNYRIRYDRFKKLLFENDWVERIVFLDSRMSIVFFNKQKTQKGVVEIVDRMMDDNLDAFELYSSIIEKRNTYVLETSDIIKNHYRVDVLEIIRKKRIPTESKGMKVVQLRDLLSFLPLANESQKISRFYYEPQDDYSPFKDGRGSGITSNSLNGKNVYLIVDVCNPDSFQPRLIELDGDVFPETESGEIFTVKVDLVDGLYLVNELWKTYFKEQLFPHGTYNFIDDPHMASDLFLSLYIQIPDCETSVERQRNLYEEEKLKYLKSINQSYGYNIDEIAASKATSLPEGTLLYNGKYKVLKRLRSGGFGKTYKAIGYFKVGGKTIKSEVAIKEFFMSSIQKRDTETLKVVTPLEKLDEVFSSRKKFMVEAEKIKQFSDHPHIVDVYDVFDENDTCYYTMEYIEGGSLMDYVEQTETCTLQEEEALKIIREVASALSAMHSHRMNHLDVKPENILMSEEGKAVLIDFGAAHKFSNDDEASSLLAITSGGFSPIEIGLIKDFSPSTDIYSLGATLYWLLTGDEPPREGLSERDEKPDYISEKVWKALSLSLRTYREDRPQSIEEFLALLE